MKFNSHRFTTEWMRPSVPIRTTDARRVWAVGVLAACAMLASPVQAAVPATTSIEGVLTSSGGGAAADGTYQMTFRLYPGLATKAAAWSEGPVAVIVKGGRFSYRLGQVKPLSSKLLGSLKVPYFGVQIGGDPELKRRPLSGVLYAHVAAGLACSGCVSGAQLASGGISAAKVGFAYAGSTTKGGPAKDLACTACVSVKELKFDGDISLGGFSFKAKNGTFTGGVAAATITAAKFIGDGSQLTGIKVPSGQCSQAGEVVKGINADGSLKCVKALDPTALPADGLNEISNNLLTNQFQDTIVASKLNVAIFDNQGTEAVSNLTFPNIGKAQTFSLQVHIENSNLGAVRAIVLPPNDKKVGWTLCDPCGKKDTKILKKTYSPTSKPKTGDIGAWIGKNPVGLWNLKVLDSAFCIVQQTGNAKYCNIAKKTDGWIASWHIKIQTLSNKKVGVNGDLYVQGKLQTQQLVAQGSLEATTGLTTQKANPAPAKCDASQAGRIYFNTKDHRFYGCNSLVWARMDNGISADLMTTNFTFSADTAYSGSSPAHVADHVNRTTTTGWPSYCVQSAVAGSGHWLKVDFGAQKTIVRFAVQGYPGGSHKPSSTWYLQASNDNATWTNVWSGAPSAWITGAGTYPPKHIITVTQPGAYRYYRLYASQWTNKYLLVCNWAMYD